VTGTVTRTDGDGRFFMHAVLPTQATLALQILLHGESQAIEVLAAVERSAASDRQDASVSLTMAG
jgi:predicted NAD/FAD-binding protein